MTVPGYLTYYAVLGSVGILAAVLVGLGRALLGAGWPPQRRRRTMQTAALVLAGWLAATGTLAWLGAYRGTADGIPTIPLAILLPIVAGVLLYRQSQAVADAVAAVPQQWLVGIQLYRVLGAVFVVLFAAGQLPGLFALPAGLGDLAVGLLAPVVALAWARAPGGRTGAVRAWNIFGIADLVVALGAGFATSPSPIQVAALEAPNLLITAFPLVLIPAFLVPLSILLHLASLAKLQRRHAGNPHPAHADAEPA